MTGYAMEILARQRTEERLREADRDRLAKVAATGRGRGRPWHAKLTHAIVRRQALMAEAR
jgi:hypothetical protein